MDYIDSSLIDWSRAQFALTAMYHWIFVPLTLGLGIIMAIVETVYYRTNDEFWKKSAQYWQKLFGINFAIGVATGIILEFQFGNNWSNYSWFVGDIFGAPLAIEGILAFFMEATFIAVMFFGWNKVSKGFHLASTWLTIIGASLSALFILVANAWMQYPVGMHFNPDTVRTEMSDFWAILLSPVAINKFFHTIISSWIVGAAFAMGVCSYYLLKGENKRFALSSLKISAAFGLVAIILTLATGDGSAYHVGQKQPMKLAAMEALYEGQEAAPLSLFGVLKPQDDLKEGESPFYFNIEVPGLLSMLANKEAGSFVPGINNIIRGGYIDPKGDLTLSFDEKVQRGKMAITASEKYRKAKKEKDAVAAEEHFNVLQANFEYFGYGYIRDTKEFVPPVGMVYYAFRIMVGAGMLFLFLFPLALFLGRKKSFSEMRWFHVISVAAIPFAYIASQAGWVVAELGRQPWAIQDVLPVGAAASKLSTGSVQTTFFMFLILFTVLLIAEVRILLKAIKKGPETN